MRKERVVMMLSDDEHAALQRAATYSRCGMATYVRDALLGRLSVAGFLPNWAQSTPQVEGMAPNRLPIQDMSDGDVGLGPAPVSAPKAERLAHARAALATVPTRRGFETRLVGPNGLKLEVPIPGESYVDEND